MKSTVFSLVLALTLMLPAQAGAANKTKILHEFTGSDGASPHAGLIFDKAGNLYGTTTYTSGFGYGDGTVFKLTRNSNGSWTETVLYGFTGGVDGHGPTGGLIFDGAGNLYGTTNGGGDYNNGVVFKLTPASDGSWTESVLYSFPNVGPDGGDPQSSLIFDKAGNLYGTTLDGGSPAPAGGFQGGTVFKLTPNPDGSWTESVLHDFCSLPNCADGSDPQAALIFDKAGNLYSTLWYGGVFELSPASDGTWTETLLYNFGGPLMAGLISDKTGNLYGAALTGGNSTKCAPFSPTGCGFVFKLTPNPDGSWTESVLHTFEDTPAGNPFASLIFDACGNLYGTTAFGGPENGGVVYKLSPRPDGTWAYKVLHIFVGLPALNPYGSLILDKAGHLYGTTQSCSSGVVCNGTVFEITADE